MATQLCYSLLAANLPNPIEETPSTDRIALGRLLTEKTSINFKEIMKKQARETVLLKKKNIPQTVFCGEGRQISFLVKEFVGGTLKSSFSGKYGFPHEI